MTIYFSDGCRVLLSARLAAPEIATAQSPALASRIGLALTLIDDASDAELASLVEARAGSAMVKAYRKERDLMVAVVAETSGMDAARVGAK